VPTSIIEPQPATHVLSDATIERLAAVPILASLNESTMHCLDGATELHLAPGKVLVHQGEVARFFWIMLDGSIEITNTTPDGQETLHFTMTHGAAFGEVPLMANIASATTMRAVTECDLLQLDEEQFWLLMTSCPDVRKAILGNMAMRLAKMQAATFQQEKMASLGTLAAGLMHELNNPGAAARRASSQLRDNLLRMHALMAKFSKHEMNLDQKLCMFDLQEVALGAREPQPLNSIEQADAEEALSEWMEEAGVEEAWKRAPTLVSIGMRSQDLERARATFPGNTFSDAINWLEALVSSMQLVGIVEESISRVTDLVQAVKSYAYEGRGEQQVIDVNASIHATLVILSHKIREKQLVLDKSFAPDLVSLHTDCQGLNQIWTNLLDNAIAAAPEGGTLGIRTWTEEVRTSSVSEPRTDICIMFRDNGPGIPLEIQSRIFDPFYTTKPVGIGTGLGLGIVFRIVEQCGGTLRFTSAPGNTEFVVRLPAAKG
jgi:signal transduction histidine kinase